VDEGRQDFLAHLFSIFAFDSFLNASLTIFNHCFFTIYIFAQKWNEFLSFWSCRYIHFVKGYFKPVLTKEAETVISSYYQLQRKSAAHNAGST